MNMLMKKSSVLTKGRIQMVFQLKLVMTDVGEMWYHCLRRYQHSDGNKYVSEIDVEKGAGRQLIYNLIIYKEKFKVIDW